jgi:hypothetical protein
VFAQFFVPWEEPAEDDMYLGRLPFPEAQRVFARGGPVPGRRYRTGAGWHGTNTDPERGSFAAVRAGGPLEGLLGERVRVTRLSAVGEASVYAYCHTVAAVAEDISLTRRAFLAVALPAEDEIDVTVEVIA